MSKPVDKPEEQHPFASEPDTADNHKRKESDRSPASGIGNEPTRIGRRQTQARTPIGAVLNDLYQVRRLIARGGMGEVYEGTEINTGERVAIKIILPHLAADPKMQALFLREARALMRLSHPGLVQYRVFANDRNLDVFYIVTEFVDGPTLSDALPKLKPSFEQILSLTERLASALGSAHEAGQVHRDISPDNILLPQGRLEQAKIVDFGIAKSLAVGNKTIIGDGYAGKLGYVTPEQLAEQPDEEVPVVGPWTDVYALALVILAVARGKPVPMGRTLMEAVERRKGIPDLSPLPATLRPIFASMLAPDPAKRLRSMNEVLTALGRVSDGLPESKSPREKRTAKPRPANTRWLPWIVRGASAALIVVMGGAVVLWLLPSAQAPQPISSDSPTSPPPSSTMTVDAAGGGDFTSIADALARAETGQRIEVKPGRYREALLIAKDVTIVGTGAGVIVDSADHRCAEFMAGETMIGLTFETVTTDSCLEIQSGSPHLQEITVRASSGVALQVSGDATPSVSDLNIQSARGAGVVITARATGRFERIRVTAVNGHGIVIAGYSAPSITGGQITNVQGTGVLFLDDARGTVQGVTVAENAFTGIELGDRSSPEIAGNVISNNARSGVLVRGNSTGRVTGNVIRVNNLGGVVVAENSAPDIESNKIEENKEGGIYLAGQAGGTVSRNEITSNNSYGIAVDEKSGVLVVANRLSKNKPPQLVTRAPVQAKFENNVVTP